MENAQQVEETRSTRTLDAPYAGRAVPADWFLDPADPEAARRLDSGLSLEDRATALLDAHADRDDAETPDEDGAAATVTALHPGGAPERPREAPAAPAAWLGLPGLADPRDVDGELAWQVDALCAQTDPEAFFPEKGGSTRDAKKVCSACTVRSECLEYALGNDERFGIWGGLSERERRRLRKRSV
ncbi:WhiB family transcriptional regulator [Citricoccus sp. SGAir0253]|uniref:WhiB family transcriptional regulator n=1 Tax=Citricoccus sp. SGAir0253 TaxID=2567881 RepID=UPI0010CD4552|nr:WhiB family transcriptional regulator [Citricoccus sp. SGAir0253]QCU78644.1 WhiB family transcriptional regulator [Citricoccus sp. SGAir0253]